mmetsp:Transcript_4215/g.6843  ORF Transcript_4215/g.6843 Transcript_4215/m.6843 type:complete len:264 (-) Transcript_4215:1267-2058(-)
MLSKCASSSRAVLGREAGRGSSRKSSRIDLCSDASFSAAWRRSKAALRRDASELLPQAACKALRFSLWTQASITSDFFEASASALPKALSCSIPSVSLCHDAKTAMMTLSESIDRVRMSSAAKERFSLCLLLSASEHLSSRIASCHLLRTVCNVISLSSLSNNLCKRSEIVCARCFARLATVATTQYSETSFLHAINCFSCCSRASSNAFIALFAASPLLRTTSPRPLLRSCTCKASRAQAPKGAAKRATARHSNTSIAILCL